MPESDYRKEYAKRRIERAKEDLEAACLLFEHGDYRIANNRAYYSIFHALRSVLAFDGFDSSKHSGIISEFRRRYIKEGVFPLGMSKMIGTSFVIRNASDYDDMYRVSRQESEEQLANAAYIYRLISEYVKKKLE